MTIAGQLASGVSEIVRAGTNEVIGYAYAEATPTGQLQRWLLYLDPQNSFQVRPPPTTMQGWSLGDWVANVPRLWKSGSFYVRALSDVYAFGGTYGGAVWQRIPRASQLPQPSFPSSLDDSHQLDPLGKNIRVTQEGYSGLAFTVGGLNDPSNAEYWLLPAGYKPAGDGATAAISIGTEDTRSLDAFIDVANSSFQTGSAFVITGCVNYTGEHAPALL